MKITKKSLILSTIAVLVSALAVVAVVNAASTLNPPGAPAGTMHTLENVYQSIQTSPTWSHESAVIDAMGASCVSDGICGLVWNANNCTDASNCLDAKGDGSLMLGATEYCAYLKQDDTQEYPIATTPQNYWRLPTEGELLKVLSHGFIENSDGGGFQGGYDYWSSTPLAGNPGLAWVANGLNGGNVLSYTDGMSGQTLVRCVH